MNRLLSLSAVFWTTIVPLLAGKPDSDAPKPQKITSITGTTYEKAIVTSVTPSAISIVHESGVAKVLLKDLPPDLQKKFDYDPQKASLYEEKERKDAIKAKEIQAKSQNSGNVSPQQKVKEISLFEAMGKPQFNPAQIANTPISLPSTSPATSIPSGW